MSSTYAGTFTQDFGTTFDYVCDMFAEGGLRTLGLQLNRIVDEVWPDDPATGIDDAIRDAIKAEIDLEIAGAQWLNEATGPKLIWRVRIEGSCGSLATTIIDRVHSHTDGITAIAFTIGNIPLVNGVGVSIKLKGQADPQNYAIPHHCSDYPRYQKWEEERKRIWELNDRRDRTYEEWKRQMAAYRELLRKTGSAFNGNGEPYPTPYWPEEVENRVYPVPPEPPHGTFRARWFNILWTVDVEITVGLVKTTYSASVLDLGYVVRTHCCDPDATGD